MAYTIAVSGKGGTGKTTISGLIISQLLKAGKYPILAIDADPNSTLNEMLGVKLVSTLGDIQAETLKKRLNYPAGIDKNRYMEYQLQTCLVEENGFDLLAMGRTEGPGCYCSINNVLRDFIDRLTPNYKYVIMDNEAGMEHLSRRTTRDADLLLIVSDATPMGIRSAGRIYSMVRSLGISIGDAYLVLNCVDEDLSEDEITPSSFWKKLEQNFDKTFCPKSFTGDDAISKIITTEIERTGLRLLGTVPQDKNLVEYCLNSKSLLYLPDDSPGKVAIQGLLEAIGI